MASAANHIFAKFGTKPMPASRFGRLFAALVMLCIVAIWSLFAAELYTTYQDDKLSAASFTNNVVGLLDDIISRNIQIYDFSLKSLADKMADPNFRQSMIGDTQTHLFDDLAGIYKHGFLYVLDKDGIAVAASRPIPPSLNLATRDYFKAHLPVDSQLGLFISRPFQSRMDNDKWTIAFSRRVSQPDGSLMAVVVGAIELDFFAELFKSVHLPADSAITLFHSDGTIIVRDDARGAKVMIVAADEQIYRHVREHGAGEFIDTSSVDGIERLTAYRSISGSPLYLSVGLSLPDIFKRWQQKALLMTIGFSLLSVLVVMLALVLRQELSRRCLAEEALATLAATDGLTKLFNRRRFDEVLDLEQKRAVRTDRPLSLLMIDVDFFKAFNDTYGHLGGDEALASIATVLRDAGRRPSDLIARYGGEEFVVLLPDTERAGAVLVAETLRKSVRALGITHAGSPYRVITISVGVACLAHDAAHSASDLLRLADGALYEAKARGRNRAVATPAIETQWREAS